MKLFSYPQSILDHLYAPFVFRRQLFEDGWGDFSQIHKIKISTNSLNKKIKLPKIHWQKESFTKKMVIRDGVFESTYDHFQLPERNFPGL